MIFQQKRIIYMERTIYHVARRWHEWSNITETNTTKLVDNNPNLIEGSLFQIDMYYKGISL